MRRVGWLGYMEVEVRLRLKLCSPRLRIAVQYASRVCAAAAMCNRSNALQSLA
jgi:hypothetical protein